MEIKRIDPLIANPPGTISLRGRAKCVRRGALIASSILVVACGGPSPETPQGASSSGDESNAADDEELANPALLRAGLIAPGEYLFELTQEDGSLERRPGTLVGLGGSELMVRMDQQSQRLSRRSAWPMMCLTDALDFGDGDLRVHLAAGAPVYVIAADSVSARVGPTPTGLSQVVRKQRLGLENCSDEPGEVEPGHEVGMSRAGRSACVFPDQDPLDDADGLSVAVGAPLEVVNEDGRWTRVRVSRPRGVIEGWMDSNLVADAGALEGDPDWCGCALRPNPCDLPDRGPSERTNQAWVESTAPNVAMPSEERLEAPLREAEPQVHGCWDALAVERRPTQTARIEVRLEVDGDGQVWRGAVVQRQNAPLALAECVLERASRVRFPHLPGAVTLRYQYAFDSDPVASIEESDPSD